MLFWPDAVSVCNLHFVRQEEYRKKGKKEREHGFNQRFVYFEGICLKCVAGALWLLDALFFCQKKVRNAKNEILGKEQE